jgi:hypothetical protein
MKSWEKDLPRLQELGDVGVVGVGGDFSLSVALGADSRRASQRSYSVTIGARAKVKKAFFTMLRYSSTVTLDVPGLLASGTVLSWSIKMAYSFTCGAGDHDSGLEDGACVFEDASGSGSKQRKCCRPQAHKRCSIEGGKLSLSVALITLADLSRFWFRIDVVSITLFDRHAVDMFDGPAMDGVGDRHLGAVKRSILV